MMIVYSKVQDLECGSFGESDEVLDVPFIVEEVEHALKHLKPRRAGGLDNILPEQLKNSSPTGSVKCSVMSVNLNSSPTGSVKCSIMSVNSNEFHIVSSMVFN